MKLRHSISSLIISILCSTSLQSQGFNTLSDLQSYAHSHEEYPNIDNTDLLKPDYSSFYKKNLPTWYGNIARFLGLQKPLAWTPSYFKTLVESVGKERENNGYRGRFVQKIVPKPGSKFIIFGDLFGAFHSFVRDLAELKRQGYINENLEIINPLCYLVIAGDAINMSPYNLETLTLILRIMQINPHNVIYVRGQHEDKEFWYNFGLKQELEIRAKSISSEKIPLATAVNRFFNTLPLAFYLVSHEDQKVLLVRISHFERKLTEFTEDDLGDFFNVSPYGQMSIFNLVNKKPATVTTDLKALIRAEERSVTYVQQQGIMRLDPDQGATAWALLSSPTRINRSLYEFFFDAFGVITTTEKMADWTIALYNRDVRDLVDFQKSAEYNLISGDEISPKKSMQNEKVLSDQIVNLKKELGEAKTATEQLQKDLDLCKKNSVQASEHKKDEPLVLPPQAASSTTVAEVARPTDVNPAQKDEIVLGTSQDLSSFMKVESTATELGLNLAIAKANKEGGVKGKKLKLITLNDEYKPELARKNIDILKQKYNTDIMLMPMGSTPIQGYMDLIKEGKVLALFPSTGSAALRDPNIHTMIHFRPSYDSIYFTLMRYAVEQLKVKKIAIVYANDWSSANLQTQVKRAFADGVVYQMIDYDPGVADLSPQAMKIKDYRPDAIIFLTTSRPTAELLRLIGASNLIGKSIITAELGDAPFKAFLKENGLEKQSYDSENVPNPATSQIEIMKEYRQEIGDVSKIDIFSAEAYVTASLFIDRLRHIDGPITKESIIAVLENTKNYDYKGMHLNFNPVTRELSPTIWLDAGKPDWMPIPVVYENEVSK